LPKYRGPSPMQAALLNGDEYTGVAVFILDEKVDHGPMLAQEIVKIEPDDNFFTLSDKLAKKSAAIINQVLADYETGKTTPLPQDNSAASQTKIITKDDGKIVWTKSAQEIYNQFRAFYPWPGIWTTWEGKKLKITDCMTTDLRNATEATDDYGMGAVLGGGVVACGQKTFLQIRQLQLEGKSETDIKSFLNGYKNFVNSKLE
jgi:methionyl-tRNA formyltransferase